MTSISFCIDIGILLGELNRYDVSIDLTSRVLEFCVTADRAHLSIFEQIHLQLFVALRFVVLDMQDELHHSVRFVSKILSSEHSRLRIIKDDRHLSRE